MNGLPIFRVVTTGATLYLILLILLCLSACAPLAPLGTSSPAQCRDTLGCVTLAPGEPIKIGGLQTLSGGSAPAGIEQERSIRLAVEQRGGKLLGHPIEMRFEDERCSSEGGANAALRIVADPKVVAILGTNCSSAAITAGNIMSEKGLVMISSANTSPMLTGAGGKPAANWVSGYFRTAWNDSLMGRAAATFAFQDLKLSQAAVVNSGDTYSQGLTDLFTQVFEELGGKVVLTTTVDEDETDLGPTLDAIAISKAQLVFFPLSSPISGSWLVGQAKEMDALHDLVFIGGEGMLSDVFLREAGQAGQGVYILGPDAPYSAENDRVKEAYRAKYGELPPSFYYSFSIDAVNLLFDALQKVAVQEKDGSLLIGRQALRDALYETRNFQGLTGSLSCTPYGDCGVAKLRVVRCDSSTNSVETLSNNVVYTVTANP